MRESAGGLAKVGGEVGQTFDVFMGKLVYDFSAAGRAGSTLNDLLSHMQSDLQDVGRFFGNLGAALASFASQMPGLAEVLLSVIAGLAGVLKWVVELSGEFQVFGVSILTVLMAYEEFNRWGGLITGLLGRMGLAAGDTSAAWYTLSHAGGVLVSIVGALPMALGAMLTGLGLLMSRVTIFGTDFALAGGSLARFGGSIRFAVAEMTPLQAALIAVAAIGLGILIDKALTAKSAIQQMTDSMQDAAEKASNLDVLNVVGSNLSKLQGDLSTTTSAMDKLGDSSQRLESGAATRFGTQFIMQAAAYRSAVSQITAGQVQQITDAANVVTGAQQIAKAYGITVPAAMALAQSAGVSLTGQVQNQKGQWTALGERVRDAAAGYAAMGQSSGALGNDMLALAIQTGLAGTKVSALNQAWDSFMGNLTGGTSALAGMVTSMKNIGSGVASVKENLAESTSAINASTSQFATDLTTMGTKGAAAWQNFDQVVGSTGPQVADWLRTAAAEGALGAHAFGTLNSAALDLVSGLIPLASKSKAAQAEVLGLAQDAGSSAKTFGQLKGAADETHASLGGLTRIIDGATVKMGNMAARSPRTWAT